MGKQKPIADARTALMSILYVQYLACQGLAVRGHVDRESYLSQLLNLSAPDIPDLGSWLARNEFMWRSHEVLNEMIELFAHYVLRTDEIKRAEFFSKIRDKTVNITVKEQVLSTMSLLNILKYRNFLLDFTRPLAQTEKHLFELFKDVLLRHSLPIRSCRGQCDQNIRIKYVRY